MRVLLVASVVLLAGSLAGCGAPSPPAAKTVHHDDGYVTIPHAINAVPYEPCLGFVGSADLAGVGVQPPSGEYESFSAFDAGAHLLVPDNVSAIVLDLWWQGGATSGIRSQAVHPDGTVTQSDARLAAGPDTPIRLRFNNPEPGKWEWSGVADPVAAGVVLHLNEGLYFEAPEPLGFACNVAGAADGA